MGIVIKSAEFVGGAVRPEHYPPEGPPEVAFAGRSNVGKSSLINCLVNRRKLVKTSCTPGRTQEINFFRVNGELVFVDLPGFGYAHVSKAVRANWRPMVGSYLERRSTLCGVVLLMDARRRLEAEEEGLLALLASLGIPAVVVVTKADKLSKNEAEASRRRAAAVLGAERESVVLFSAKTGQGRDILWDRILSLMISQKV